MKLILQVQITRSANLFAIRVIWTRKKVPSAKSWLEKAIKKCIYNSNRRFEFRRIRDIRVRDIDIRLYLSFFSLYQTADSFNVRSAVKFAVFNNKFRLQATLDISKL